VEGLCACGTVLSKDRLSLRHGPSGSVGRVLESGHTAGEPILARQGPRRATATARALAEPWRFRTCKRNLTDGNQPHSAIVGVSQWHAARPDEVLMGTDDARRVAKLLGGDAVTAGGVAAGDGPRRRGGSLSPVLAYPPDPQPSISMMIHGGNGAPLRARRLMLARLGGQLTPTGAADAGLIVSELVTNSVVHANVGPDQTVTVECTRLPDRLRITVTDPGSSLEPHLRPPGCHAEGGYGLAIVSVLSLAWGVLRGAMGTTSVWSELPLETVPRWSSTDREHQSVRRW
jgi:anti-sigma regulatory factor (Ser/Thr protein kinase)